MILEPNTYLFCPRCGFKDKGEAEEFLTCPNCKTYICIAYFDPTPGRCRECFIKKLVMGVETYTVSDNNYGTFTWNVEQASRLASQDVFELDIEQTSRFLQVTVNEPLHYDHIDPTIPGIVAQVPIELPDPLLVMIDGGHRAGRCLRDKLPFSVRFLEPEESRKCILHMIPSSNVQGVR